MGERLDSYRRILKFASNHILVSEITPDAIKSAMQAGRGWVVFEGGNTETCEFNGTTQYDHFGYVSLPLVLESGPASDLIGMTCQYYFQSDYIYSEHSTTLMEFAEHLAFLFKLQLPKR